MHGKGNAVNPAYANEIQGDPSQFRKFVGSTTTVKGAPKEPQQVVAAARDGNLSAVQQLLKSGVKIDMVTFFLTTKILEVINKN